MDKYRILETVNRRRTAFVRIRSPIVIYLTHNFPGTDRHITPHEPQDNILHTSYTRIYIYDSCGLCLKDH